jgi:hypothetical protein
MATLAAYELASLCDASRLHVYAFGSPPTSNHAFAREYDPVVPNTWQVATDQVWLLGMLVQMSMHVPFVVTPSLANTCQG